MVIMPSKLFVYEAFLGQVSREDLRRITGKQKVDLKWKIEKCWKSHSLFYDKASERFLHFCLNCRRDIQFLKLDLSLQASSDLFQAHYWFNC